MDIAIYYINSLRIHNELVFLMDSSKCFGTNLKMRMFKFKMIG